MLKIPTWRNRNKFVISSYRYFSGSYIVFVKNARTTRSNPRSYDSLIAETRDQAQKSKQQYRELAGSKPRFSPQVGNRKSGGKRKINKPDQEGKVNKPDQGGKVNKSDRGQSNYNNDSGPKRLGSPSSLKLQALKMRRMAKLSGSKVRKAISKVAPRTPFTQPMNGTTYSLDSSQLTYNAVDVKGQPPVPELAHNLDRTLFNPGVHFLRDPRTNVYNFTPYLENIMSIKDFDFRFIPQYVPSGKDGKLAQIAKENKKKYTGSTSSLTSILSHFHYLLSQERDPQLLNVSKNFDKKTTGFTFTQRKPASIFLRYNQVTDTHSIDSDNTWDDELIVTILGNSLETLLTTPEVEYDLYHKSRSHKLEPSLKTSTNTYNYTSCGDFMMRSQLDCFDPRLPGTGMFDLKTRAVCAVRHDMDFVQVSDGTDYVIRKLYGEFESFEREWYDLVRSSLLKYSLQARIGRMDGIFVAYHNIRKMFGFQYVPLIEMDKVLHTGDLIGKVKGDIDEQMTISAPLVAEAEFKFSVMLLNKFLDKFLEDYGDRKQDFNIVFFKSAQSSFMNIFIKPMKKIPELTDRSEKMEQDLPKECSDSSDISSSTNPTTDFKTIWQDALDDIDKVPDNTMLYQVKNVNFINGNAIAYRNHPCLRNDKDNWTIESKITNIKDPDYVLKVFTSTFKDYLDMKDYTSSPSTERLDFDAEQAKLMLAIKKLKPPSLFQSHLRKLGEKGLLHDQEIQKKFADQEVKIWFPRPLNMVQHTSQTKTDS